MSESKSPVPVAEIKAPGMVKEFVVGAAGGITQVMIGQPFDIVKVRMQVQANKSAVRVAQGIWRHEGLLAFYKGTLPPLLGVGACISIVYSTFHTISQSYESSRPNSDNNTGLVSPPSLSPSQTFLVGGLAGLANSVISGPTEHIRIRLQTQSQKSVSSPTPSPSLGLSSGGVGVGGRGGSVLATIRQIHSHGGLPGLYRGQVPTMLREFGSYGVWFSVYETLLSRLTVKGPKANERRDRDELPTWKIASCGVVTGLVLWTVNYPFDVVKSKMQADGFGEKRVYKGMRDVVVQTWKESGLRGFYRGLGPTLVRAVPVSGCTFVVVEMVRNLI
ncbi:mitochondrial carrier domain-containing protein [Aspergillus undulatus]|uniref:mitochondrial carrier domain-containing protein n=1 Tax=Aspergillus undulatus TaxID=1810928 RepID=UPI003CCDC345